MGKIILPNIYEKRALSSYNSGLYGVKFFSEFIENGYKEHEVWKTDYYNADKHIDLIGFDCFFSNGTGNLCSYLEYGSKEERSPDAGEYQQEERVRALFDEFERHPDITYNIICNGKNLSKKTNELKRKCIKANVVFEKNKVYPYFEKPVSVPINYHG